MKLLNGQIASGVVEEHERIATPVIASEIADEWY
jgi:hypothetical protein